jgi:hypothetical protein
MQLATLTLWRILYASRNVHPFYHGLMRPHLPGWRRFLALLGEMALLPLLFLLWALTPLLLILFGLSTFNRTRSNIQRLTALGNHDLLAAATDGPGGLYWWCFAATFHRDRNTRSLWRVALFALMLLAFGLTMLIFAFLVNIRTEPDAGEFLLLLCVALLGLVGLGAELFLSVLLGGLIAIRTALSGVNMGTRLLGMLVYGIGKLVIYFGVGLFLGLIVVLTPNVTWAFFLVLPGLLALYLAAHELLVRLLWHELERLTALSLPLLESRVRSYRRTR